MSLKMAAFAGRIVTWRPRNASSVHEAARQRYAQVQMRTLAPQAGFEVVLRGGHQDTLVSALLGAGAGGAWNGWWGGRGRAAGALVLPAGGVAATAAGLGAVYDVPALRGWLPGLLICFAVLGE